MTTSRLADLYESVSFGDFGPYSGTANATTEDILVVIARLIAERVTPAGGARMLTAWTDNGEVFAIEDQPIIYFRDDEPYVIQDHRHPSAEDASNAECRVYHPDTIHIAPDGTTQADRDVAMAQLLAALTMHPQARQGQVRTRPLGDVRPEAGQRAVEARVAR